MEHCMNCAEALAQGNNSHDRQHPTTHTTPFYPGLSGVFTVCAACGNRGHVCPGTVLGSESGQICRAGSISMNAWCSREQRCGTSAAHVMLASV